LSKHSNKRIPFSAIGVIFITSSSSRDIVLARVLEEKGDDKCSKILTVDPEANHLVVASGDAMSNTKFDLNLEGVFSGAKSPASVSFTYNGVLVAALEA